MCSTAPPPRRALCCSAPREPRARGSALQTMLASQRNWNIRKPTLKGFVKDWADLQATVYTDDAGTYDSLPNLHETVKHSVSEYVRGQAHNNGVESFWSMLKCRYYGTSHKMSREHLQRYVQDFTGRHSVQDMGTIKIMGADVFGIDGKQLKYDDLVKANDLDSGERAMTA